MGFSFTRIHPNVGLNAAYLWKKGYNTSKLFNACFSKQLFLVVIHNLVQFLARLQMLSRHDWVIAHPHLRIVFTFIDLEACVGCFCTQCCG